MIIDCDALLIQRDDDGFLVSSAQFLEYGQGASLRAALLDFCDMLEESAEDGTIDVSWVREE